MRPPPRFALWLLTKRLPPEDRDDIIGDLDEDFRERCARVGERAARRWYTREAIRLAWAVTPQSTDPDNLFPERRRRDAEVLWRDFRFAARRLLRQPLVTAASIATLAASIGAATATWSLIDATLLTPIPAFQPERVMVVGLTSNREAVGRPPQLGLGWNTARRLVSSDVFGDTAMYGTWDVARSDDGSDVSLRLGVMSTGVFRLLGVPIALGRDLTAEDDRAGVARGVIVSSGYWRRALDSDPHVIGRSLKLNGQDVTIVGVAARTFSGLDISEAPDVLSSTATAAALIADPDHSISTMPLGWRVIGRLRDRESVVVAQERLRAALVDLQGQRPSLTPLETAALSPSSRLAMRDFARILSAAVVLLLGIGCLTVGMLVLIRTERRRDEFAVCLALGATRFRLARSVLIEGLLLAAGGGLLSIPAAAVCLGSLGTLQVPGGVMLDGGRLSLTTAAFIPATCGALAATLAISLIAGAFGFRQSVAAVSRSRSGSTPPTGRRRTRAVLTAGQAAVTLVLVSGAALFGRSLQAAMHVNPGFETEHLVTGQVRLSAYRFDPTPAQPLFAKLVDALLQNPAFRSVSLQGTGVSMSPRGTLNVDGVDRQFSTMVAETAVDERYFSTVGLPILAGRDFTARDDARAPLVIVVSESFGRQLANGQDPVGHRVQAMHGLTGQKGMPLMTVIGVVPDVITSVGDLRPLVMYVSVAQEFAPQIWSRNVLVRPAHDVRSAEEAIVGAVRALDPTVRPQPSVSVETMDEQMARQMGPQRLGAVVLGSLGTIALLLTTLGTYVLAESMVVARRREMGIRAALGAGGLNLGSIVLGETARLVGLGVVVGVFIVWAEAATVRAFLLRTEPLDPMSLAGAAALILVVTAVVSLRPALAASRVDVIRVLRDE